jgi:hypothetical protein
MRTAKDLVVLLSRKVLAAHANEGSQNADHARESVSDPTGKVLLCFPLPGTLVGALSLLKAAGPLGFLRLLGAVAFVSGVYAVSDKRAQWIIALALAIPAVALNTVHAFRPDPQIALPMLIFTILFLVLTLVSLLRAVVHA